MKLLRWGVVSFVMSHMVKNFEHKLLDKHTNFGKQETDQDEMQRVDNVDIFSTN